MDCLKNENVCSVKKEDNTGYYRLHTKWKDTGFFLSLTSKTGAWHGEMTEDDVKRLSGQLNLDASTYMKECKEALTTHDGLNGMVYAVENGTFTWKKVLDEDSGVKIKMGSVLLKPTSFVDVIQDIVHVALQCNKNLMKEVKKLNEKRDQDCSEKKALICKMEEIINLKDQMESDLYKRFLLLLNSKKRRIAELECKLKGEAEEFQNKASPKEEEDPYEMTTDDNSNASTDATDCEADLCAGTSSHKSPETPEKKPKRVESTPERMSGDSDTDDGGEKVEEKMTDDSMPSTKQELLEYFYGS